jgi:hypothetical protein
VFVFACESCCDDVVYVCEGRLLVLQVTQKTLDVLFFAFEQDFYSCVAPVAHVASQPVLHCYAVNEGAETDALNDACNVDFDTQLLSLL